MATTIFAALVCLFFGVLPGYAQSPAAGYTPMGSGSLSAYDVWESLRVAAEAPTADDRRPVLPGVNGRNLELLQDAVARKWPHVTQGSKLPEARRVLAGTTESSLPALRGAMAEAIFLEQNQEWKYVGKPNAPQHDVYAPNPDGGRGNQLGQVKFHMGGDPAVYARDMVKDHKSKYFIVPDDHVEALRAYLKAQGDRVLAAGDQTGAAKCYRNMNRVVGIGRTSAQIDAATRQAITEARVVRVAPYVFLGVSTTVLVVPTAWEWYQGRIDGAQAAHGLVQGGTVVLAGVGADQALKYWKGGLLRGTLRGNAITASVVLMADTAWQVYQHGSLADTFQDPVFLVHLGGSISATGLAMAGGYAGALVGTKVGAVVGGFSGPQGAAIGAAAGAFVGGVAGGTAAGAAGYYGGAKGTYWAMETFCPELLYEQEHLYIMNVQEDIRRSLQMLSRLTPEDP
jgi:hypothetical protein